MHSDSPTWCSIVPNVSPWFRIVHNLRTLAAILATHSPLTERLVRLHWKSFRSGRMSPNPFRQA